ncbi:anti-sigma factor family protein [Streptomyces catenulae]|uniref:Zf-HC2 domain-containing protein n=1 Tax=Streptomyces catenulae TaxID=66875 RepID=A0ABV2Z546_9ACTN|nr:zf-HC2 domain-containing protein [Streptomyces catenulae]
MTSTTGTDEHPEVAEISDLAEGLLSPARTAEVRAHLASCALCEDVFASLEEIRGLLGTLPGPVSMPAEVAGRIDAALAAEALLNAAPEPAVSRETSDGPTTASVAGSLPEPRETPDPVGDVSRETVADTADVSRETEATPPSPGADRPAGRPRGATGPGRRTPGGRAPRSRRWPRVLLGTAAAAALIGVGGIVVQSSSTETGDDGGSDRQTTATDKGTATPGELSSATLATQVHKLLATKGAQKVPEIGTRSEPETPMRGGNATVPSCVSKGIGRPEAPLAARQDTYEGKNVYLVVLSMPADPKRVTAYVVDASCISATPPAPGDVLLSRSYLRD